MTYTYQGPSDFRLKCHHGDDQNKDQKTFIQILEPVESESLDHKIKNQHPRKQDKNDPPEQSFSAGALEKFYNPVNHQADKQ